MTLVDRLSVFLTFATALGSGLIAGVFFAFSTFVMRALARLPAAQGIAAMQAINVTVINPVFMGVFLGTAVASVAVIVVALMKWNHPAAIWLLAGGVLYLVGTFLVTIVFNVPLNDSLATLVSTDASAAEQWAGYVSRWTMWNHVRMLAALGAMGSLVMGVLRSGS